MMMRISVVIPTYNEEKYIGKCLDSLMHQEVPPDEIIIVNNNSTDNTVTIVKNYPVRLISEKKQGRTPARNRGFNEAKYDIIARTDADTTLPLDWIKRIKISFQDPKLIALSGPAEFNDLPEFIQNTHWQTKPTLLKIIKAYSHVVKQVLKHDFLYGPNYSIRKSAWKKIKDDICLDDDHVHEDLDLAIHLAPLGKIKFDNSFVVNTSSRRWKKPESYIDYIIKSIKSVNTHKPKFKAKGKDFIKKLTTKNFIRNFLLNQ